MKGDKMISTRKIVKANANNLKLQKLFVSSQPTNFKVYNIIMKSIILERKNVAKNKPCF